MCKKLYAQYNLIKLTKILNIENLVDGYYSWGWGALCQERGWKKGGQQNKGWYK